MSGLGVAALIAVAVWMGALTLVLVLVIRQIALVTARLDRNDERHVIGSFTDDGPEVGSAISELAARELPSLMTGTAHLVLLSATCRSCRVMAAAMREIAFPRGRTFVALVPGRAELAAGLVELLPSEMRSVLDPTATEIADSLELERVPSALTLHDGIVVAKAPPLDTAADLLRFVDLSAPSPNGAATVIVKEDMSHAVPTRIP